jgi:PPOX class probable F420-dependent enzyme
MGLGIDEALAFVRANHRSVLATTRSDGGTQMSPVTAGVDAEGRVVVSSRETAYKVRHLLARPRGALCVFTDSFDEWLQVEGPVEVVRGDAAIEPLVDYYRAIRGEHPDWAEYRAVMVADRRVLLRLTPTRVGPTVAG